MRMSIKKILIILLTRILKELEDTINFSINLNKPVLNKDLNYRFVLDTIKIPDSLFF